MLEFGAYILSYRGRGGEEEHLQETGLFWRGGGMSLMG